MQYALILDIVLYDTGHYTAVHCMCMVYYRSYNAWCLYRVMHFSAFMQCASLLECTCDEVTVCNFLQFAPQHCVQRLQSASSYYSVFEQKSVKKICVAKSTYAMCIARLCSVLCNCSVSKCIGLGEMPRGNHALHFLPRSQKWVRKHQRYDPALR